MLNLKESLDNLESSDEFKTFKKDNPKAYLCSFFKIAGKDEDGDWQIDFYLPNKDKITSFLVSDKIKTINEESKIFKKKEKKVRPLNINKVKINLSDAISIIEKLRNEKYPYEKASKEIIILQNIKVPIWNVTYITTNLNLLNVKVNAISGKIIEESLNPALSFSAK